MDVLVRLARAVERLRERDLTLGQGAGLVGEQDLDVAEVLDRDQALDDHALLGQPAGARREADGDDRRQQLRRQADRDREREQGRLEDRASERGVDHEDRAGQHRGHGREQAREVLQPLLERGHPLPLAQAYRDRTERRARARANDDAAAAAAAHERAHEHARAQIQRRVPRRLGLGRLLGRPRLAGQHRLVALELVHLEQPQIGGNHIPDPQMHDITRNELCHGDLGRSAVAIDRGKMLDLGMQLLDRLLRAVLVEEAQTDAHRHDRADDQRLRPVADHRRDDRRDEQQQQQVAAQLADEHRPGTDSVRGQNVRPVDAQAPARLAARKTRIGRAELAQHIRHRQRRGGGELELLRLGRRSGWHGTGRGCRVRCRLNLHRLSLGAGDDPSHRPPRQGARELRPARRSPRSRRSSRRSGRRPRDPVPSSPTRNPSFSTLPVWPRRSWRPASCRSRSTASTSVRRSRNRLRAYRPATQPRGPQRRERNGRIRVDHGLDAVHRPLSFGDGDSAVPPTRGRVGV